MGKRKLHDEDGEYRIGLVVSTKHDGDGFGGRYFRITAYPVKVYGSRLRNFDCDDGRNGLEVSSLGCDDENASRGRYLFGWEVGYRNIYHAKLTRVERMAQTMRAIERGLKKLNDGRGYPHTFGEYLGRVAEALGATLVCLKRHDGGSNYDASDWELLSVGDGVSRVDMIEREWHAEGEPKPAEAPAENAGTAG